MQNNNNFNKFEQQKLKTQLKALLTQIQQQVDLLVHYRNSKWSLYPFYFMIPNKTFTDLYYHDKRYLFVLHHANSNYFFKNYRLTHFNLNGYHIPALPCVEREEPTDFDCQILPFYWFFFQINNDLYGVFYFELPEPLVNLSYLAFPDTDSIISLSSSEALNVFNGLLKRNYQQTVLDYKLQEQPLVSFLTLDDFLASFELDVCFVQNVFFGRLIYEMSFSTFIADFCTFFESLNIPIRVVGYPPCGTSKDLSTIGDMWKSDSFHPPTLRFANEKEAFIHYTLLDMNPKYIQKREEFSDYEFSLITQYSQYSAYLEHRSEGEFMSWYVKLMEFNFYYIYGFLELSGDLTNDANLIYKFLGELVRRQLPGAEMCGSFWNRSEKRLYFWIACYSQNCRLLLASVNCYSYVNRGDLDIVLNCSFFSSISNSEWDFRTFVSKYMSYPKGGKEKAPLNLHYYVLCNPNNYVVLHVFGNIFLPNHYLDFLIDRETSTYNLNPAWLEKDYQGKISALDYFMFYVLFDDRQFDALGYGLGPQIQIWLLLPYRISFLSIL